ncbi:MAG: sigma-70 family RNA polymerase sigma factor [Planctomycetia bacterium]|nr:sigma-70 family RNA polymerase sigma factor [Planctomycetia bacterium]
MRDEPDARVPPDDPAATLAATFAAARAGDAAAFDALHRRFVGVVHGIALARVGPDDADDVTQEVFLTLHRRLADVRDPAALPGWVCTVATHAALDRVRRRARERVALGAVGDPGPREARAPAAPDPAGDADAALRARALAALQSLPEAYREALVWRLVEGLTGPEIAARTGRSPGAVRVHLCKGLALLRARLAEDGPR